MPDSYMHHVTLNNINFEIRDKVARENLDQASMRSMVNAIHSVNCNIFDNAVITSGAYIGGYNTDTKLPIITETAYHPDWTVFDMPITDLTDLNISQITIQAYEDYSPTNKVVFYKEGVRAQNYIAGTHSIDNFETLYDRVAIAFDSASGIFDVELKDLSEDKKEETITDIDTCYIRHDTQFETRRGATGKRYLDLSAISYAEIICPSDYVIVIDSTWKNHATDHTRHIEIRAYDKTSLTFVTDILNETLPNSGGSDPEFTENFVASNYNYNIHLNIDVNWSVIENNFSHAMFADKAITYIDILQKANEALYGDSIPNANKVDFSVVYRSSARNVFSAGYNVNTKLPIEQSHNGYLTYVLDMPAGGEIHFPYTYIDDGSTAVVQVYTMDQNQKITANTNIATYASNLPSSRQDLTHGFFKETTYMGINCSVASKLGDKYVYLTVYSKNRDVYITPVNSYVPDWFGSEQIIAEASISDDIEIVMPEKIVVGAGKESNIYYQNIARYFNPKHAYSVSVRGTKYANYGQFARYTPGNNAESGNVAIGIFPNLHNKSVEKSFSVQSVSNNAGSGTTKKVLCLGDSMTDADAYTEELVQMFSEDSMNIQLVGTLGSGTNLNEGRSGWRAFTYCRCPSNVEDWESWGGTVSTVITNPFYNSTTGKFDFARYMSNNGFSGVDYVFICLGTNDIIRGNYQTDQNLLEYYDEMIASIHAYSQSIRIGLWLPPTRALYPDALERSQIDASLRTNKLFIDNYGGRENERIYLVPVYLNIDPFHDYQVTSRSISARNTTETMNYINDFVHPSRIGYNKIADVIFGYIKYFASLD